MNESDVEHKDIKYANIISAIIDNTWLLSNTNSTLLGSVTWIILASNAPNIKNLTTSNKSFAVCLHILKKSPFKVQNKNSNLNNKILNKNINENKIVDNQNQNLINEFETEVNEDFFSNKDPVENIFESGNDSKNKETSIFD